MIILMKLGSKKYFGDFCSCFFLRAWLDGVLWVWSPKYFFEFLFCDDRIKNEFGFLIKGTFVFFIEVVIKRGLGSIKKGGGVAF